MTLLSRALRSSLAIVAVAYPLLYLTIAWYRLSYPYELEWMEGATVDHVRRVLSGKQLYVEPSMEFVPFTYTPLYYYVCAIVSKFLGTDLQTLRLVSLVSSAGCLLVIFMLVRRETQSVFPAVLSAGLFSATYKLTGSWFDLARVDTLFLFLLLGGLFFLRFHSGKGSMILSGLLMSLAFLTKQITLPVVMGTGLYCFLVLPRWSKLLYPATVALSIGLSTLVLNLVSDGWFFYYGFSLPLEHVLVPRELTGFWLRDIAHLSIAFVLSVVYLGTLVPNRRRDFVFYTCVLVSMIGASWISRLHSGGYHNVLLPGYAAISICFGLGTHILLQDRRVVRTLYEALVILLCLVQFGSLAYNPAALLPSESDRWAGDGFVAMLGRVRGEVFVPYHGFLPALAGKRTYAHTMAISDVLRGRNEEVELTLRQDIEERILGKRYELIVLDTDWGSMQDEIETNYRLKDRAFGRDDVFWPVTGKRTRPELVYELIGQ